MQVGDDLEGIVVLNLPCYGGGSDLWGPVDPNLVSSTKLRDLGKNRDTNFFDFSIGSAKQVQTCLLC